MAKKCSSVNHSKVYKTLREYVKIVMDTNATLLDGEVADAINKSEKSIQNVSSGSRDFRWSEAKKVANYFIVKCGKSRDVNNKILRQLAFEFLLTYGKDDENAEVDEDTVKEFLKQYFEEDDDDTESKDMNDFYSNLPDFQHDGRIIRDHLAKQIKSSINAKRITFLSGFTGTGKSFLANITARKYLCNVPDGYRFAIWNESGGGKLTYNTFISNILSAFKYENAGNLTADKKTEFAESFLSKNKSIIVIDGYEGMEDIDKQKIISFIQERTPNDTLVIITSNERMSLYRDFIKYPNRFCEVKVDNFSLDEWKELSFIYGESRIDISEAKKVIPELDEYIYKLCRGNPFLMTHILSAVAEKVLTGFSFNKIKSEYLLFDIDQKSYEEILGKSVKDLSDNSICMLTALSFFATPISLQILSIVSGLKGVDTNGELYEKSDLAISILKCHNLFLVEQYYSNGLMKFSLPAMLRPIMESELIIHRSKHKQIIEGWISYYRQFSATIGFCFDSFGKLTLLDNDHNAREIDNIKAVLDYCEHEKRWADFYTISENTKYYFYTRGISGEGKDSIHYKRAYAARMLNNYKDEFDSLVYHCNVACKSKSWDSINSCFDRIEELRKTVADLPKLSILKYNYIRALYTYSNGNYDRALKIFEEYENEIKTIIIASNENELDKMVIHDYVASLRWHSECLYLLAQSETEQSMVTKILENAKSLLDEAVFYAKEVNFDRAIVHSQLIRIKFNLFILRDQEKAAKLFDNLKDYIQIIDNDAMYSIQYKSLSNYFLKGEYHDK